MLCPQNSGTPVLESVLGVKLFCSIRSNLFNPQCDLADGVAEAGERFVGEIKGKLNKTVEGRSILLPFIRFPL
jgi:hypothetical protein